MASYFRGREKGTAAAGAMLAFTPELAKDRGIALLESERLKKQAQQQASSPSILLTKPLSSYLNVYPPN